MRVELPVLVQKAGELVHASLLLEPRFAASHRTLASAMESLGQEVYTHLRGLARADRFDEIARFTAFPPLAEERLELDLAMADRSLRGPALAFTFHALERRVAFTTALPDAWFTLDRGQGLPGRAETVLTAELRRLEKEGDGPRRLPPAEKAWLATLEVELRLPREEKPEKDRSRRKRARLGAEGGLDGEAELRRVGRRLEALGLDGLDRALFREREVEELTRCLRQKRPVALVGPAGVGKTAVLHQCVRTRLEERRAGSAKSPRTLPGGQQAGWGGSIWLLSPGRLISGMTYVGQWEERLLAILAAAAAGGHALYFDDLPGLFRAGRSAQSDLTVGHVLTGALERREVALAGEITPEALGVLRERQRAFADQLHLIPVAEPSERQTRRVLLHVARGLEAEHGCRFATDAVPAVLELGRRWIRHRAFPGKAVPLLRRLAQKPADEPFARITREDAYRELHRTSGLALAFLDDSGKQERASLAAALASRVVGQRAAVEALADVVSIARSHLGDPGRPFASLLFLGPTGVGKTQLAKSLAELLFGSAERLLRFDMNEYAGADAAARLVGTPEEPEGQLASAIRRQPWCVLLLDEIEKAHPCVFDLLLQVLDDGRLTDALGRTADFKSAFVVLTSNLGARDAASGIGFEGAAAGRTEVFRQAAERFFRPELMGRLDRVVVFQPLERDEVRRVALMVLAEVFAREGFRRRHAFLDVHPDGLERVVDEGYHPQLGARALKRSVERNLVQEVAGRLAAVRPGAASAVRVLPATAGDAVPVRVLVEELREARAADRRTLEAVKGRDPAEALERFRRFLTRLSAAGRTPIELSGSRSLGARELLALQAREAAGQLAARLDEVAERLEARAVGVDALAVQSARRDQHRPKPRFWHEPKEILERLYASRDAVEALRQLASGERAPADAVEAELSALAVEATYVEALSRGEGGTRALLLARTLRPDVFELGRFHAEEWAPALRLEGRTVALPSTAPGSGLWSAALVEGPLAARLAELEAGTHLFWSASRALLPVQVFALPVEADDDAVEVAREALRARAEVPAAEHEDPLRFHEVVRSGAIEHAGGTLLDVRNGCAVTFSLDRPRRQGLDEPRGLAHLDEAGRAALFRAVVSQMPPPSELLW